MFFTKIAYGIAWLLLGMGVLAIGAAMLMKAPAGMTAEAFFSVSLNMLSTGAIMIGMGIGIGLLAEISLRIAER